MQRYAEYIREALTALWQNKMRSVLTMLGMIIGTSSVIAVFGISRAAATGIAATITSFGTPGILIRADPDQMFPGQAAIHFRDAKVVATMASDLVAYALPTFTGEFPVRVGNKKYTESVQSTGAYAPADNLVMLAGRKITQQDYDDGAFVATLTSDIAQKYFGHGTADLQTSANNAVGQYLTINGDRFHIIGVYSPLKGGLFNAAFGSNTIIIPSTSFYSMTQRDVDFFVIYARDPKHPQPAIDAALAALRHIHGPLAKYTAQSGTDILGTLESVLNTVGVGLSAIGAVALVVAGIGIMNIMLVSVAERRREIGIRKSIGASRNDIVLQFLLESIILASIGGSIGLGIGLLATLATASAITAQLGAAIIPYALLIAIAAVFSIGIGLAFGMYPAMRAAQLDPVEALRS